MTDSREDQQTIISAGRRVIDIEVAALNHLGTSLDADFAEAVRLCQSAKGRIVLAGVGKSGHVARKISATLASTGTPSLYIHPTEASHGDLGMITATDVVIALSRSGETRELSDLIAYCVRFSIPLIAMTAAADSALARAASINLLIPDAPEACGETRAPTTSTTLCMALGDALAVAVLELNGFTAEDFKIYHPGGKLGAMLRSVGELMHSGKELPVASLNLPLAQALEIMSRAGFGCLAIIDEKDCGSGLVGMVTDGDIRRLVARGETVDTIGAVMSHQPITVRPDSLASQALAIMNEHRITQLIVTDPDHRPVGILHMHDLLRAGLV